MAKSGFTVKGVDLVLKNINNFTGKTVLGAAKGLRTWGEATMAKIKERDVPREFGVLAGSGKVETTGSRKSKQLQVELSFGGSHPASGYAIPVHEVPAKHSHGSDKYLERGALSEAKKMKRDVAQAVKRATGMR